MALEAEEKTLYVANLDRNVDEEVLYELFLQAGPIEHVDIPELPEYIPEPHRYGFVTYVRKCSIDYAIALYKGTKLFEKELVIKKKREIICYNQQMNLQYLYAQLYNPNQELYMPNFYQLLALSQMMGAPNNVENRTSSPNQSVNISNVNAVAQLMWTFSNGQNRNSFQNQRGNNVNVNFGAQPMGPHTGVQNGNGSSNQRNSQVNNQLLAPGTPNKVQNLNSSLNQTGGNWSANSQRGQWFNRNKPYDRDSRNNAQSRGSQNNMQNRNGNGNQRDNNYQSTPKRNWRKRRGC